jgi:hypothetical protein
MPEIVSDKVAKELLAGRMAGPLFDPTFSNLHCSPLGLVPKKDPSNFCMIHHLSHPKGQPVNDCMPTELSSVQYTRASNSLATLSETISGIASADGRLRQFKVILKSKHETENPCVNPFTT